MKTMARITPSSIIEATEDLIARISLYNKFIRMAIPTVQDQDIKSKANRVCSIVSNINVELYVLSTCIETIETLKTDLIEETT